MASDRDWERELAKIDKQLAGLSDDELLAVTEKVPQQKGAGAASQPAAPSVPAQAPPPARPASRPPSAGSDVAAPVKDAKPPSRAGVYIRLLLSVGLGVSMLFWPYASRCGIGLVSYMAAVGVVVVSGLWSAGWSWKVRMGRAQILSLVVVLWGLLLGAQEILPRVGYAIPTDAHPAGWVCE